MILGVRNGWAALTLGGKTAGQIRYIRYMRT